MTDEKKKPTAWSLIDFFDGIVDEADKKVKDAAEAAQKLLDDKKAADEKEAKKKEAFALMDEWADENLEAPVKEKPEPKAKPKEGEKK